MDVKNEGVCLARQGSSRKIQISAHDIYRVEFGGGGGGVRWAGLPTHMKCINFWG